MASNTDLQWWEEENPVDVQPNPNMPVEQFKKDWYSQFVKGFNQRSFSSIKDYENFVRTLPSSFKEIHPYMQTIAKKYMPRNVRMQYEKALSQREAQENFQSQIEQQGIMQSKILDEVKKGNLPDGTYINPKTGNLDISPYRVMGGEVEQLNQKAESQKSQQMMKYYALLEKQYNREIESETNPNPERIKQLNSEMNRIEQILASQMQSELGITNQQSQAQQSVPSGRQDNNVFRFNSIEEAQAMESRIPKGTKVVIGNQIYVMD